MQFYQHQSQFFAGPVHGTSTFASNAAAAAAAAAHDQVA
jgi:hypothetical protein